MCFPLLCLAPSTTPGSAAQRAVLPACLWLDEHGSRQANWHSGVRKGARPLLRAGFSQLRNHSDRSGLLAGISHSKSLSVPHAARRLDIKMSATVLPPWCILAGSRKWQFPFSQWPWRYARTWWELIQGLEMRTASFRPPQVPFCLKRCGVHPDLDEAGCCQGASGHMRLSLAHRQKLSCSCHWYQR